MDLYQLVWAHPILSSWFFIIRSEAQSVLHPQPLHPSQHFWRSLWHPPDRPFTFKLPIPLSLSLILPSLLMLQSLLYAFDSSKNTSSKPIDAWPVFAKTDFTLTKCWSKSGWQDRNLAIAVALTHLLSLRKKYRKVDRIGRYCNYYKNHMSYRLSPISYLEQSQNSVLLEFNVLSSGTKI